MGNGLVLYAGADRLEYQIWGCSHIVLCRKELHTFALALKVENTGIAPAFQQILYQPNKPSATQVWYSIFTAPATTTNPLPSPINSVSSNSHYQTKPPPHQRGSPQRGFAPASPSVCRPHRTKNKFKQNKMGERKKERKNR